MNLENVFSGIKEGETIVSPVDGLKYQKLCQSQDAHHTEGMFASQATGRLVHYSHVLIKQFYQREHVKVGDKDRYPEIDCHIKEAEGIADELCNDPSVANFEVTWTRAFTGAMDNILSAKGLRVL